MSGFACQLAMTKIGHFLFTYERNSHIVSLKMSSLLLERIRLLEVKLGRKGAEQFLCQALGKSRQTLSRWLRDGFPQAHDAYRLALACGLNEQDALAVARECVPDVAKVG